MKKYIEAELRGWEEIRKENIQNGYIGEGSLMDNLCNYTKVVSGRLDCHKCPLLRIFIANIWEDSDNPPCQNSFYGKYQWGNREEKIDAVNKMISCLSELLKD